MVLASRAEHGGDLLVFFRPQCHLLKEALLDGPAPCIPSTSTCFLSLAALPTPDSFVFISFLFLVFPLLDWQCLEGQDLGWPFRAAAE